MITEFKLGNEGQKGETEVVRGASLISEFDVNPLDAGRRLTDFSQTSYAAGSRLTY